MCKREQIQHTKWKSLRCNDATKGVGTMTTVVDSMWLRNSQEIVTTLYQLWKQVASSARGGQTLPLLTMILIAHVSIHVLRFGYWWTESRHVAIRIASLSFIVFNTVLNICGYSLLIALYRHSVSVIFNRAIPPTLRQCIPSFGAHMALLRPLEVCWRYATVRFRVLPDVIVLGEVRCGTTTLCHHLASVPGCHEPFCLWKHPELDKKESFYFVGHYLGIVDPQFYQMCFPLAITKWFHQVVLRKPFFAFDGCAQYLSSPSAPYLIAEAFRLAGQPPPVLVACVRDPVDQALSWWRFENGAMSWGSSMGLSTWNTRLRSSSYPPLSISDAIDFSLSDTVEKTYKRAEVTVQRMLRKPPTPFVLPSWALTWPSGQLSAFGRNGSFCFNISRYERVFSESFPPQPGHEMDGAVEEMVPSQSKWRRVNVVPLELLKDESNVVKTLKTLVAQIVARQRQTGNTQHELQMNAEAFCCSPGVHRNATNALQQEDVGLTKQEQDRLIRVFAADTRDLESLCGVRLGWKTSSLEQNELSP